MYKVFINEHLIQLTENVELSQFSEQVFICVVPNTTEMKMLAEWLLKEKNQQQLILVGSSADQLLSDFKTTFEYIEAAGGHVKNEEGLTLMIYRMSKWDLPKGKIEKGEATELAALREVEEECGIDQLQIVGELESTYHMYQQNESIVFKKTYWYNMITTSTKQLLPQAEEGIEDARWMKKEEVTEALKNTYPSIKLLLI